MVTRVGCLAASPPILSIEDLPARVHDGCPKGLVCHTNQGYLVLVEALEVLGDYVIYAWTNCRDDPGEGETP